MTEVWNANAFGQKDLLIKRSYCVFDVIIFLEFVESLEEGIWKVFLQMDN